MTIVETSLKFDSLSKRKKTDTIVLHHSASKEAFATLIHQWHKNRGWSGIGYHFVVRKNGTVERGRPIDCIGAHCTNENSHTIGICFEGNFQEEDMAAIQIKAGRELIDYIQALYGNKLKIVRHRDLMATACPGDKFPFSLFTESVGIEVEQADIKKEEPTDIVKADLVEFDKLIYDKRLIPAKHIWKPANGYFRVLKDAYINTGRNNFTEPIMSIPKGATVYSAGYYMIRGFHDYQLVVAYRNVVGYIDYAYVKKIK